MWGSYGSYSSMSSCSAPIDIRPSSSRTVDSVESHYAHRSSFSSCDEDRPTSFLSDDDLFACDSITDDDNHSVSSSSSSSGAWSPDAAAAAALIAQQNLEAQHFAQYQNAERKRRQAQQLQKQKLLGSRKRKSSKNVSTKSKLNDISE